MTIKEVFAGNFRVEIENVSYDNKTEMRYYDASDNTLLATFPAEQDISCKDMQRQLDEAVDNHKKSKESKDE